MNNYPDVKIIERKLILDSYLKVSSDRLIVDGNEITREVVKRGEAVAVVPILANGKFLLVKQYRHPAENYLYEIPSGMVNGYKERVVDAVNRELEEETGYKATNLEHLYTGYPSPGVYNELIHIYIGKELILGKLNLDYDEVIEVYHFDHIEIKQMAKHGHIMDMKTMLAFSMLGLV